MSKSIVLPDEIYAKAAEQAEADRMSIEDFISGALADQLAARDYLQTCGSRATRDRLLAALNEIPVVEPDEHDRL